MNKQKRNLRTRCATKKTDTKRKPMEMTNETNAERKRRTTKTEREPTKRVDETATNAELPKPTPKANQRKR